MHLSTTFVVNPSIVSEEFAPKTTNRQTRKLTHYISSFGLHNTIGHHKLMCTFKSILIVLDLVMFHVQLIENCAFVCDKQTTFQLQFCEWKYIVFFYKEFYLVIDGLDYYLCFDRRTGRQTDREKDRQIIATVNALACFTG